MLPLTRFLCDASSKQTSSNCLGHVFPASDAPRLSLAPPLILPGTRAYRSTGQSRGLTMTGDGSRARGTCSLWNPNAILVVALLVPSYVSASAPPILYASSSPAALRRPAPGPAALRSAELGGRPQMNDRSSATVAKLTDQLVAWSEMQSFPPRPARPGRMARPVRMPRHVQMPRRRQRSRQELEAFKKEQAASVVELPRPEQARAWTERMRSMALALPGPPKKLGIIGMPNTGTNALEQLLGGSLDVEAGSGVNGTWKHLLPFHPTSERELTRMLTAKQPVFGAVFIVRHPLTWMQAETSDRYGFGLRCGGEAFWPNINRHTANPSCFFETCHSDNTNEFCHKAEHPRGYRLPSLVDTWAAYVSHVFDSPRTLVVRYEDLLQDRHLLVDKVARHFKLGKKSRHTNSRDPLSGYSRQWDGRPSSSGIGQSRERWQSYVKFWGNLGAQIDARAPSLQSPTGDQECMKAIDPRHYLVMPANQRSLQSGLERGIVQQHLDTFGYGVPEADLLDKMWTKCFPLSPASNMALLHRRAPPLRRWKQQSLLRG